MTSLRRRWGHSRALDDGDRDAEPSELGTVHERLRRDAVAYRRPAPDRLKEHVLAALAGRRWDRAPADTGTRRIGSLAWAAAAFLAVASGVTLWNLPSPAPDPAAPLRGPYLLASSVERAAPSLGSVPTLADGALRRELESLALDTTRAVESVRDRLPRPLRLGLRER